MRFWLLRAFPDHPSSRVVARVEVRDEDYAAYVELHHAFQADGLATVERLDRLEEVLDGSPPFLDAYLFGADLLLSLASSEGSSEHLERARRFIDRAAELEPGGPRVLRRRIRAVLFAGRLEQAAALLDELATMAPADLELRIHRASLAERQGRLEEAHRLLLEATSRTPSWHNYERLARLEMQMGRVDAARQHLQALLELVPGQPRGLARLARLELLYGDLEHAAGLYRELLQIGPQRRSLHTNLGLALFLLRRYDEALASYRAALAFSPRQPAARLNLADAEWALGRRRAATAHYRSVRDDLEPRQLAGALSANESMILAQCLARLGEAERAVAIVQRASAEYPHSGEVAYQAAVVYALVGDSVSARAAVRRARGAGVGPRWFSIDAFDRLRADPELAALFEEGSGSEP